VYTSILPINTFCQVCPTPCHATPLSWLTHKQSTSAHCVVGGYRPVLSLYDLGTGGLLRTVPGLHDTHINVVKFSHHSPNLFCSSSFDRSVKVWDIRDFTRPIFSYQSPGPIVMACWSPDDRYVLTSALDNDVRQLCSNDGKLHCKYVNVSLSLLRSLSCALSLALSVVISVW
jgi:WD40 repeat protein